MRSSEAATTVSGTPGCAERRATVSPDPRGKKLRISAVPPVNAATTSPRRGVSSEGGAKTAVSSKDGNTFGRMVVEDFDGSHELVLFGEEFQKFKNYFEKGIFIYCKGTVEQKVYRMSNKGAAGGVVDEERKSRPRLRISQMMLLNDVMSSLARSLTLKVNLESVTDDFCDRIANAIKKNKGKADLKLRVIDNKNKISLIMQSTSGHIDIKKFLKNMENLPEVIEHTIGK